MGDRIGEGSFVILKRDEEARLAEVRSNGNVRIGKLWFATDALVGQPFGGFYDIAGQKLVRIERSRDVMVAAVDNLQDGDPTSDNRSIVDDNRSQTLTTEAIEEMKKKGVSGKELIDKLVENSATFKTKTEFSQAKYL
eukprot:Opistho-2@30832